MLYVGTDDGNIYVSKNSGGNWELINNNLPAERWVSSIMVSSHDEATVFVSLNGYRYDEITTYIYKSTDYGKTWQSIKGNLPDEAVNVIIQDPVSPDLLYIGTDEGAYASMDAGKTWHIITGDFPNVATYDMIVHPRDKELVLATHGRSMYVMDVKPLEKISDDKIAKELYVFKPDEITHSKNWGKQEIKYLPANEPEVEIMYFLKNKPSEEVVIKILDKDNQEIHTLRAENKAGFNRVKWNLKTEKGEYLSVGKYKIQIGNSSINENTDLVIKATYGRRMH